MLTESDKLLITAAVDGELSPAETTAFERLVMSDAEAALLFRQLKDASARLAALPKLPAPKSVAANVMARVRPVTPARKVPPRRRSLLPYIIAASLFLAVTVGSALLFRTATEQAQRDKLPPPDSPVVPENTPQLPGDQEALAKAGPGEDGVVKPAADDGAFAKLPPAEVEPVAVVQVPKPLTPEEKELFGVGLMVESKPLRQVDPALPMVMSALDFDKDEPQAKLKKELTREGGFRLNLFSKNTAAGVEQVQAAARAVGVHVFVEANTAERIKKATMPLPYAVYVENLTADELAALLAALSKQANEQPKPETLLGSAHLVPAEAAEHKDLKELIGVDWPQPKAVKPGEGKSVSDGTLKEVVASVKKGGEKAAVVVTFAAKLNAGKSAEVKQFLDVRGERKAGTVPLLIVVRPQS
jgi:anti-sigma factor RsiW